MCNECGRSCREKLEAGEGLIARGNLAHVLDLEAEGGTTPRIGQRELSHLRCCQAPGDHRRPHGVIDEIACTQ